MRAGKRGWRLGLLISIILLGLMGCNVAPVAAPNTSEEVIAPTPEVLSSVAADTTIPAEPTVCDNVTTYSLRDDVGLAQRVQLKYLSDTTLEIEGWRVEAGIPRFHRYQLDIGSGKFTSVTSSVLPDAVTVCTDCTSEVLEVLPDAETALVAVTDSSDDAGIWLVSTRAGGLQEQLVKEVPQESTWGYSQDGVLFWLEYSRPEYGRTLLLVYVDEGKVVQPEIEVLDPTLYWLTFSPAAKSFISYPRADENPGAPRELVTVNVSDSSTSIESREPHDGVVRVLWQETSDSMLIVGTKAEQMVVTTFTGEPQLTASLPTLQETNDNIDSIAEWQSSFVGSATFAIAPDASSFAIADGRGKLHLCQ